MKLLVFVHEGYVDKYYGSGGAPKPTFRVVSKFVSRRNDPGVKKVKWMQTDLDTVTVSRMRTSLINAWGRRVALHTWARGMPEKYSEYVEQTFKQGFVLLGFLSGKNDSDLKIGLIELLETYLSKDVPVVATTCKFEPAGAGWFNGNEE